jgi:phage terminase small subunit
MTGGVIPLAGGGRPRKPTREKQLAGTARADRANPREPVVDAAQIPAAPAHLSPVERELWARWAEVIEPWKIVTRADLRAFERLVQIDALITEAHRSLYADAVDGVPRLITATETKNGVWEKARVELEVISKFEKTLLYYFSRFGLTPADRSRVSIIEDGGARADPDDEFASPPGSRSAG